MIDIQFLREHPKKVQEGAQKKGVKVDVSSLLRLDEQKRAAVQKIEKLRAQLNQSAKSIATLVDDEKKEAIAGTRKVKQELKKAEEKLQPIEEALTAQLYSVPNLPFDHVPVGASEKENVVLKEAGRKPQFSFPPKDYLTLTDKLDLIDTERAGKVSGSRFGYLKNGLAVLEWAIVLLTMRRLSDSAWIEGVVHGNKLKLPATPYIPMVPPVLLRPEMFRAMGKLDPGQEEERYFLQKDGLYLVGSAEHSMGPYHAGEIFSLAQLPRRYIAFSTCFRREAGSYGKDTKGILRVHQFDKLEMFSYVLPEHSQQEHRFFLAVQEALMHELDLPYRVVAICTGDMVWTDAEQFDIETWLPGQKNGAGEYRETHSTSNSTDFQSRRLQVRYRGGHNERGYVHTINGTAFAIGRTLIAIVENYQQADGSVRVPEALQPWCGFDHIEKT